MKYRFITKLACRIMAIYFFVTSLNYVPNFIVNLMYYHKDIENMGYTMYFALSIIIPMLISSILLWVFAERIARSTVKENVEGLEMNSIDYKNVAILAFAVMGMFVLIVSIPSSITNFIQYKLTLSQGVNQGNVGINYLARLIGDAVKILMSIWLIFGSRGIVNIIRAFRNFGTNALEEPKK